MCELESIIRNIIEDSAEIFDDFDKLNSLLDDYTVNAKNLTYFKLLTEKLSKQKVIGNLSLVLIILKLGLKFWHARLTDNDFWTRAMELDYSGIRPLEGNEVLYDFLLREGTSLSGPLNWKFLAILTKICYDVPRSKQAIVQSVREKFNTSIGVLLDNIKDYQQANYLIELLSNCFPRKSTKKPGVVSPPTFWILNEKKNNEFFENPLYPFRGQHGDHQVTKFIWNVMPSAFEKDVLQVTNITNSGTISMCDLKNSKTKKVSRNVGFCFVQAVGNQIYLWNGEGQFLEIERKGCDITRTMQTVIRIQFKHPSSKTIRSVNRAWLSSFIETEWFQFDVEDADLCDLFFRKITVMRRISEPQTFLALNNIEDESQDLQIEQGIRAREVSVAAKISLGGHIQTHSDQKCQLVTPEQSKVGTESEIWDFGSSTQQTKLASDYSGETKASAADRSTDEAYKDCGAKNIEQSPLVSAQQRKKQRKGLKTLDSSRKEIAPQKSTAADMKNVALEKLEHGCKRLEQPKTESVGKKSLKPEIKMPENSIHGKSVSAKDIFLLDKLFGKKISKPLRKKHKRQEELKNPPPKIKNVSQEVANCEVKHRSSSTTQSSSISRENENGLTLKNRETDAIDGKFANTRVRKRTLEKQQYEVQHKECIGKEFLRENGGNINSTLLAAEVPKDMESTPIFRRCSEKKLAGVYNSNTSNLNSTTLFGFSSQAQTSCMGDASAFTNKLQEQIFSSITGFSEELIRKMNIINQELNTKIIKELSEKYQRLFRELQTSFQSDTEDVLNFMSEINEMMNLSEEQLVDVIKNKKFPSI